MNCPECTFPMAVVTGKIDLHICLNGSCPISLYWANPEAQRNEPKQEVTQ
jgi:hypothetical protein